MSMENNFKRHIFPYQQSQVVFIDINFQLEVIKNVLKTLRDIISLTVSISGPSRIPKFGMVLLNRSYMFPLKNLKENYEELLIFLNNCENSLSQNGENSSKEGIVLKYLYTFAKQFSDNDLSQNFNSVNGNTNQSKLEFTIISDNVDLLLKECRDFCRNSNIRQIQRIHIVVTDGMLIPANGHNDDNSSEISTEEGVIEINNLRCNHCAIFEDIFKNWLLDQSLDSYHLDLLLKHQLANPISIKCDLQECLVNPSTLPQASSLMLEADYSVSRTISYAGNNKLKAVPIYQLEAISKVDLDGICESLIYGQPLLLRPTMCWRLDINQLTETQLLFQELCNELILSNKGLILRRIADRVASFYLVVPANNYLILKCLTSKELLMPRKEIPSIVNIGENVKREIGNALATLKSENEYNPIIYESGIYNSYGLTNRKNKRSMNSGQKVNIDNKISFGFYDKT